MFTSFFAHMRILSFLIICFLMQSTSTSLCANNWYQGNGTPPIQGTTSINDLDTASQNYAFDPLNRLLSNYRENQLITYASASTLTVTAGEVVVNNGSTTKLMLQNTSDTTVTWADIDTGTEAVSTTYYVYAIAATSASTTATYKISTSATAPTGATYYKKLGSFYNDASGNITVLTNDAPHKEFGDYSSKTAGVTYQAATDGFVMGYCQGAAAVNNVLYVYVDFSSTPTTVRWLFSIPNLAASQYDTRTGFTVPVKAGEYYKVTVSSGAASIWFVPLN